jgi:hypothetical protein
MLRLPSISPRPSVPCHIKHLLTFLFPRSVAEAEKAAKEKNEGWSSGGEGSDGGVPVLPTPPTKKAERLGGPASNSSRPQAPKGSAWDNERPAWDPSKYGRWGKGGSENAGASRGRGRGTLGSFNAWAYPPSSSTAPSKPEETFEERMKKLGVSVQKP